MRWALTNYYMKKYLFVGVLLAAILIGVSPVSAEQSVADLQSLQAQINQLLATIKSLQTELAALKSGGPSSAGTAERPFCYNWTGNLRVGDYGMEVAKLQSALEKDGFAISDSDRPQKDGQTITEFTKFGESTASAVVEFQEKYASEILTPNNLRRGTGFVGVSTRAKLNQLYGCKEMRPVPPPPVPPTTYCPPDTAPSSGLPCVVRPTTEPSIAVISPNGGETLTAGQSYTIRWNSSGIPSNSNVRIGYYLGKTLMGFARIAEVSNTGSYNWVVPTSQSVSELYRLSIQYRINPDTEGVTVADYSDSYFTIVAPTTTGNVTEVSSAIQPTASLAVKVTIIPFTNFSVIPGAGGTTIRGFVVENTSNYPSTTDGAFGEILILSHPDVKPTDNNSSVMGQVIARGYLNSQHQASLTFLTPQTISSSRVYTIAAVMKSDMSAYQGSVGQLSLVSVLNDTPVTGTLPITGARHTFNNSLNVGTISYQQTGGGIVLTGNSIESEYVSKMYIKGLATDSIKINETGRKYSCIASEVSFISTCIINENLQKSASLTLYSSNARDEISIRTTDLDVFGNTYGYRPVLTYTSTSSTQPSITVLSPNGGENIQTGQTYAIRWNSANIPPNATVKIGYYLGPLLDGLAQVAQVSNTGIYNWTIPSTQSVGTQYKIGIEYRSNQNTEGVTAADSSDSYFTITAPTSYYPGFNIKTDKTQYNIDDTAIIQFGRTDGKYADYAIDVYTYKVGTDNLGVLAKNWNSNAPLSIKLRAYYPGDGKYALLICAAGQDCSLGSSANTNRNNVDFWIVSNATTQPSITVLSPNGGERWARGSSYNITWTSSGLTSADKIDIRMIRAGEGLPYIAMDIPASAGVYSWTIPNDFSLGDNYIISINKSIAIPQHVGDSSNFPFTIVAPTTQPSITVLSPNGGESYTAGQPFDIKWSSANVTGDVSVDVLSADLSRVLISTSLASNPGSYTFTSSASTQGGQYIARVRAVGASDSSDSSFTITAPASTGGGGGGSGGGGGTVSSTTISSLSPTSGPIGASVTVSGNGFTPTGNKVKFGNSGSEYNPSYSLNSSDSKTVVFNVPGSNYYACLNSVPRCTIAQTATAPGDYAVSVTNANGASNTLTFTVSAAAVSSQSAAQMAGALEGMRTELQRMLQSLGR